jgi:hypothetical protein
MPEKKRRSARPVDRSLTPASIAERAYAKWLERGCPAGDGLEDWLAAQSELEHEHAKRTPRLVKSAQA